MFLEFHDSIQVKGKEYRFRNDFQIYIKIQKILSSPLVFDEDKLEVICDILFYEPVPIEERGEALITFLKIFAPTKSSKEKCFDIEQDANLVYSGFMQSYGIDLNTATLSIEQFIALLNGLPPTARLCEVIKIRTMPIPKATKNNAPQISAILKAKSEVALKNDKTVEEQFKAFGQMIRSMAHGR